MRRDVQVRRVGHEHGQLVWSLLVDHGYIGQAVTVEIPRHQVGRVVDACREFLDSGREASCTAEFHGKRTGEIAHEQEIGPAVAVDVAEGDIVLGTSHIEGGGKASQLLKRDDLYLVGSTAADHQIHPAIPIDVAGCHCGG